MDGPDRPGESLSDVIFTAAGPKVRGLPAAPEKAPRVTILAF